MQILSIGDLGSNQYYWFRSKRVLQSDGQLGPGRWDIGILTPHPDIAFSGLGGRVNRGMVGDFEFCGPIELPKL